MKRKDRNRRDLSFKEYWSPKEASLVLGYTRQFWAEAFDKGKVSGHLLPDKGDPNKRVGGATGSPISRRRRIKADSARAYLERLNNASAIKRSSGIE